MAEEPSCPAARGILLDEGLNSCLLHWLSQQGNPLLYSWPMFLDMFAPILDLAT